MAKKPEVPNGANQFKKDIKTGALGRLYIVSGEEAYLRKYYIQSAQKLILGDSPFADFNGFVFDAKMLTLDDLRDAIESYPTMAEQKIVVVQDFDLYKMPAQFADYLAEVLADLPDYLVLIFEYDSIVFKPDKRLKIHRILENTACFAAFEHLQGTALHDWIRRRFVALQCAIDDDVASYLVFRSGSSMTQLIPEIEKAAAFCSTGQITKYHIDTVCTRVLDAAIFDLTDAITAHNFGQALQVMHDLLAQKNTDVMIFTTIARHLERLYAAKLADGARLPDKALFGLLGSNSSYYIRRMLDASRCISLSGLRKAVLICGETDHALKSASGDRVKMMEFALLSIAAAWEEGK